MELLRALRLDSPANHNINLSIVGAGGKSTALFQLAHQFVGRSKAAAIVTATTHLGTWQTANAGQHIVARDIQSLARIFDSDPRGVIVITGEKKDDRYSPIDEPLLEWLHEKTSAQRLPLLIEADGSRARPLKAPEIHEPPIPEFTDLVLVVAGLNGIGKPLTDEHVHRAKIFSRLGHLPFNAIITPESISRVLTHPQGGLKNIPQTARRVVLLNQADTPELKSIGGAMARDLLDHFGTVIVGSLQKPEMQTFETTAGIILAAGESTRFGSPKQLLDWHGKPFVRHIAETALGARLRPVVVVTGSHAAAVQAALRGLQVEIAHNPEYQQGQSTSIRKGVSVLPRNTGAAIFLLSDQPQITIAVICALSETHSHGLPAILAPLIREERRANPVLFDRLAFSDLMALTGDVGGRALFSKYKVEYVPWHEENLLLDVDKPEDYQRLVADETP